MSITEKDYLVVKVKQGSPFLVRVVEASSKVINTVMEKDRHLTKKYVEVNPNDVLVNLGSTPKPGKVYNVDVSNLYRTTLTHDWWGSIHFFVKLEKPVLTQLKASLDRTARHLDKRGLSGVTESFITEIRAKHGQYAGMYQHSTKEDSPSRIWYAPDWTEGKADIMDYVIYHEFGHAVRYNLVKSLKLRARWLKLYNYSIASSTFTKAESAELLEVLRAENEADGETRFSQVLKDNFIEDDQKEQLKVLSRWMKQVHHLSFKDLALLFESGNFETLEKLWPKRDIDSSELKPLITEYACKNVEETFAETFAYHMMGKKLPVKVTQLLQDTLNSVVK